jgi:hypothetical protein
MKIIVKIRDIKIKMDDQNTESFSKYDTRVEHILTTIKAMTEEAKSLLKEQTL